MIKREQYLTKIREFYHMDLIKVITGIRRCGKSVLLMQIMDELKEHLYRDHGFRLQCSGDMLHGIYQDCEKKENP